MSSITGYTPSSSHAMGAGAGAGAGAAGAGAAGAINSTVEKTMSISDRLRIVNQLVDEVDAKLKDVEDSIFQFVTLIPLTDTLEDHDTVKYFTERLSSYQAKNEILLAEKNHLRRMGRALATELHNSMHYAQPAPGVFGPLPYPLPPNAGWRLNT